MVTQLICTAVIFAVIFLSHKQILKKMSDLANRAYAALQKIDDSTTAIAADLLELRDAVKNAGIDAATEELIVAKLEAAADTLEAMGKPEEELPAEEGTA